MYITKYYQDNPNFSGATETQMFYFNKSKEIKIISFVSIVEDVSKSTCVTQIVSTMYNI